MLYDSLQVFKRQSHAEGERSLHESTWDEALRYYSPKDRIIYENRTGQPKGEKKTEYIYDSVPEHAVKQFATIIDGYLTPRNQKWHGLKSSNSDLMKIGRVARWFEDSTDILFRARYASRSNFAAQNNEALRMLGMLGNGVLFIDEFKFGGIRYKSEHLYDVYFFEDEYGIVDTIHRKFVLTAANAANLFGKDAPDYIQRDASEKPDNEYEFLHVVGPNKNRNVDSLGADRFAYVSCYYDCKMREKLRTSGYNTFPYCVYRDVTAPRDVYATGAGQVALADTKMLNLMNKTDIKASQRAVDPPILVASNIALVRNKPGGINVGGLTNDGRKLIDVLDTGARVDISEVKMEQRRNSIKDTFLINLFQLLVDSPEKTATQVLEETREKGVLLTPLLGRLQSEGLDNLIQRELDIKLQQNALPPLPPELIEAEGEYDIMYESPLSRAQRAEEAVGIQRQLQFELSIGALPQDFELSYNMDEARRIIASANAVPFKVMLDPEEVQARQQQRAQQQAMMQAAQMAPGLAKAAKDVNDITSEQAQAT